LNENKLTGTIPASLGNLTTLQYLDFDMNLLSGGIPESFGNLITLLYLGLPRNPLTGTIPSTLSSLTNLVDLYLFQSQLSGPIMPSLGNLYSLENINIYNTLISGTIPSSLGNWTHAKFLFLNSNQLTGTIPSTLSQMHSLIELYLFQNFLSGTIPAALGDLNSLEDLYLYQNRLTGKIPVSLGNLGSLSFLYLFDNYLTGPIPNEFRQLKALQYLALNGNFLSGTIPLIFDLAVNLTSLYLFDNLLTGSLPLQLSHLESLREFDVSQNLLSGSISMELFNQSSRLVAIFLNKNAFTGPIPTSLFQSATLFSVIFAENCFSGTLPDIICSSPVLTQLVLDGLHSASACSDRAIPGLPSSGLIAKNSVHGHIPSCLLQHKHLSVLHMGGNSFSGSIPNVPISAALTELVLSSNQLTGSIPDSIWQSNITKLDLSLNRLQGTLPSGMLPAAQLQAQIQSDNDDNTTVSVKLQVNQLAGTIPKWLQSLPSGDIDVLEGNLFSCNADRSDLPANDPKAATYECGSDNTNYGLIAFAAALMCVSMVAGVYRYCVNGDNTTKEMINSFYNHYGQTKVRKLWEHIERVVYVIVGMWTLGMIVYGLLSLHFSSYANVYVWAVSGIYKNGITAALTMAVLLGLPLLGLLASTCIWLLDFRYRFWTRRKQDAGRGWWEIASKHGFVLAVVIANILVVIFVNGLFVFYAVTADLNFRFLLLFALVLSLFKIGWNYVLLNGSHHIEAISDNTVVWLCLFNNLLAPLLAEMFVSPDCFLYIVSKAPVFNVQYDIYSCQLEITIRTMQEICSVPVLYAQGYGTPVSVPIDSPFHYSFQCSFSLISSYAYVFGFRYLISGLIEPMLRVLLMCYLNYSSFLYAPLVRMLPLLWQTMLQIHITVHDADVARGHMKAFQHHVECGYVSQKIGGSIGY
jgi:Leucine-rich repeat (LRR) protein